MLFNIKDYPRLLFAVFVFIIAVAIGASLKYFQFNHDSQNDKQTVWQETNKTEPKKLTNFSIKDQKNQTFGLQQLKGKWTFMFFGYTHCPDVCPTALAMMRNIAKVLDHDPRKIKSQFVFVSIDPQRDNLASIGSFVEYFNPDFIGLTGKPLQLKDLLKQLDVKTSRIKGDAAMNYLVSHTSSIMLIDPEVRLLAKYEPPHERASILKKFYKSYYQYQQVQQ